MQKKFTRSIKNPVSRISNALSDLIKYRRYRTLHVLVTIAYFNGRVKGIKGMLLINLILIHKTPVTRMKTGFISSHQTLMPFGAPRTMKIAIFPLPFEAVS
jgi:hypothetical protein